MSAKQIIKQRNAGVLLDSDSIRAGLLSKKFMIKDANVWHAFVIHCEQYMDRNKLLQIILDYVYPLELVPLKFQSLERDEYIFFAKECSEAIHKLCANNLIIPNPYDRMSPIRMEIILHYALVNELRISIVDRMKSVIFSLFNTSNKTLYLDNFSKNEGLQDYMPLSQPKILYYVLSAAASLNVKIIRLRNNDIRTWTSQEILWKFTSLTHLDLRNNKIEDLSSFKCLKDMKLLGIYFDGNPLCDKLDEYTYVSELKQIFPNLQKIDGELVSRDGVPAVRQNFLCDKNGFPIVNKFIEIYFHLYDKDRKSLEDLYHVNAICSITNLYKIGQTTSNEARLRPYQINCRNLLAMADIQRSNQYLFRGNHCIVRKLLDLPQVEHDPYSLSIDLVFYSDITAVINVCGVFRENPTSVLDAERHLGFMRSFVLKNCNGEYLIMNEMIHVYNALSSQVSNSFRIAPPMTDCKLPEPKTLKDKEKATEAVEMLTGLTKEWARRFLEKCSYDIVTCIKTFMDMHKIDKIPPKAFNH